MARKVIRKSTPLGPIQQIELFRYRATRLWEQPLVQAEYSPSLKIQSDQTAGFRVLVNEPDETQLKAFLVDFRPFIMEQEPIYLDKIYNLCHQYVTDEHLRAELVEARADWARMQKAAAMRLIWNGVEQVPEALSDRWVQGYYLHNDWETIQRFDALPPHERAVLRYHFLQFVFQATHNILWVGSAINYALHAGLVTIPK
ncbi:MAG TPA: hypothetical protein VFM49_05535 [Chloroflexia bacterium]|nr:hypothetical protein [Chloroflexia bacterium]